MAFQNASNLTFLYRVPKIEPGPLDTAAMARIMLGYLFAFQALGYLYWHAGKVKNLEDLMPDYDAMIADSVYCGRKRPYSEEIRGGTDVNRFNQRRIRLKRQDVMNTGRRGKLTFALPRFDEFTHNTAFLYKD